MAQRVDENIEKKKKEGLCIMRGNILTIFVSFDLQLHHIPTRRRPDKASSNKGVLVLCVCVCVGFGSGSNRLRLWPAYDCGVGKRCGMTNVTHKSLESQNHLFIHRTNVAWILVVVNHIFVVMALGDEQINFLKTRGGRMTNIQTIPPPLEHKQI